jgi:propanediol dehydratase small subunit
MLPLIIIFQKFDFGFEEEDSIDGMKRLIINEVNSFRAEVRAQARAAGQIRRQDRYVHHSRRCDV